MNSGIQEWTVPVSGLYRVEAGEAKGGMGSRANWEATEPL